MKKFFAITFNKFIYRNIIKARLKQVGCNFKLGYSSELINPKYFSIGDNFYSGPYGYFVTNKNNPVEIGNAVMFGPGCKILGGNHDTLYKDNHMYFNKNIDHLQSYIIIEDGVWIGANTILLSGTKISEGTIIGAMSLVNNYIPPYTLAVGIPARKLKKRFEKRTDLIECLSNVKSKYLFDEINETYKLFGIEY